MTAVVNSFCGIVASPSVGGAASVVFVYAMSFNRELQLRSFYDAISNDCIDSCEGKATRKDADYADQLRLEVQEEN